ncbi:MAG TPA: alpha/beta hydrolase [Candidatus Nitrosotenuis sp.]|jgi:pimeloyl-ACP methyl ester carboxylesterase|nr:alpha/beta hydrolase [Candidatus Nitrosotenuis sp.]
MQPQHHYWKGLSPAGFHKLHYTQWGDPHNPKVLICLHGLSRNCRDFDYLANYLSEDYRIICPDMPGRGQSEWLTDPNFYTYPQYLADLTGLIARLNSDNINWLGTSMGGIIGMLMAAQSNTPIKSLIINDVGAFIPAAPLKRIIRYVSHSPIFPSYAKAKHYLKQILSTFGIKDDKDWDHLAHHSIIEIDQQHFRLHHDPKIITHFTAEDVNLWPYWEALSCPTLIIRGKESELFPKEIADRMLKKANTNLITLEGSGHAPHLMSVDHVAPISQWLRHCAEPQLQLIS